MRIVIYFFMLCVMQSFASCSEDEPYIPQKTTGLIVPLAVGNRWTYKVTIYASDHVDKPDSIYYLTLEVPGTKIIDGETWFYYYGFYTNRSDGLWVLSGDSSIPMLDLKYPANAGDFVVHGSADTTYVAAVDTVICVPYGCYYTYEYIRLPFYMSGRRDYYAPSIGLIKREWWSNSVVSKKIRQFELVSATLK